MQIEQEMTVLTPEQVEQVSGAATFGYYVGVGIAYASGQPFNAPAMGQAVSAVEDWVNGN
jgi:hypothetical protein